MAHIMTGSKDALLSAVYWCISMMPLEGCYICASVRRKRPLTTCFQPELFKQKQEMAAEINRIRAENNYMLYRPHYEAELSKQKQLEQEQQQRQERTRGYDGPSFW